LILENRSMSTLAAALKDEIRRLARKEIRTQTSATARGVTQHRREIAQLKRQLRAQQKEIAALKKGVAQGSALRVQEEGANLRFSARSAKAQRRRTGLSAAEYAKLVGVSPLTIYNWENGKSRPRQEQFASLVALRGIGKREIQARLQAMESKKRPSKVTGRRRAS
jgi:DNA-binding transcriptional regulator YiaG